ncbi:MAG: glycosyltransferase family 2 protein [candidate division WOR-3 bacterium]
MKLPISVVILTYNEVKNIEECLKSVYGWVEEIFIVDSYSTDKTLDIARKYTDKIYQHPFENQARQFNWALNNLPIKKEWVMRLDADERWTVEGFHELEDIIKNDKADGVYVKMKIYFMGKWIRYGDFYPNYFLRVFKKSKSNIEDRWMDEHIKVNGKTIISNIDVIESNYDRQKNIHLWVSKHNNYSTREAVEYLMQKYSIQKIDTVADIKGSKTEKKRWLKERIYNRLPLFLRAFLYYIYRYVLKLGFLDGKEGLIFHFLQGFWYRFLVDAKIYEIEKRARVENRPVQEIIEEFLSAMRQK